MSTFWFIIWGTKRTERKLGYVADFCPICRKTRSFLVSRIGRVGHIYYISLGEGELVGYLAECQTCHVPLSVDPRQFQTVSSTHSLNLSHLIQETFPNLHDYYHQRLELEEEVHRRPRSLPSDVRIRLIEEPFYLVSPLVESRLSGGLHWDRASGLGCGMTLVALVIFSLLLSILSEPLMILGCLILLGGTIYTFMQFGVGNQRYIDRDVVPKLILALTPLRPSLEELQACLNKLAMMQHRIGRWIKADTLLDAIARSDMRVNR